MRKESYCLLAIALLSSLAYSIVIEDYLYSGEKRSDVVVVPLVTAQGNYSLVKIKGVESLLVRGDSFVTDTNEITSALADHYFRSNYPTEAEVSELLHLMSEFNKTRDLPSTFGFKAESSCRQYTGMDRVSCYDRESCVYACASTFQCGGASNMYAPLFGAGEGFINSLIKLGIGYNQTDAAVAQFTSNMIAINATKSSSGLLESNVAQRLNDSYASLNQIIYATNSIRENPLLNGFEIGGYDYCPRATANVSIVEVDMMNKLLVLMDRTAVIGSIPATASKIYSETIARQDFVRQSRVNQQYEDKYVNVSQRLQRIQRAYANASTMINDPALGDEIDFLKDKSIEARRFIDLANYSLADTSMIQFNALADSTESILENYTAIKATLLALQKEANIALLKAEWELEVQNVLLREQLDQLRLKKAELDDNLTLAIAPENASYYANEYRQVINDANDIVTTKNEQAHDAILDGVVFAARGISRGLEGFVSSLSPPASFSERRSRRALVMPVLIALTDVVLIAGASIAFAYFIATRRLYLNRQSSVLWTAAFIAFFFIVASASFSAYLFFQKQAASSPLSEFVLDLSEYPGAAVIADQTNAWSPGSVRNCADALAPIAERMGKQVTEYYINEDECTVMPISNGTVTSRNTTTRVDCFNLIGETPVFLVEQSDLNSTTFNTFNEIRMTVEGDETYLNDCIIAKALE